MMREKKYLNDERPGWLNKLTTAVKKLFPRRRSPTGVRLPTSHPFLEELNFPTEKPFCRRTVRTQSEPSLEGL